jgi:hypothetical protein
MQPLGNVEVEIGEAESAFEACFRDDFIPGVGAEGKKRCEADNRGLG